MQPGRVFILAIEAGSSLLRTGHCLFGDDEPRIDANSRENEI